MEGHGAYNRSSRVQAAGLSPAVPLLERAARGAELPPSPEPLVIVDYGSSAGRNSLLPLSLAISVLRDRIGADRAISVVHTDLPDNDFSALFQILALDPDSYVHDDPAVFPCAVGRSFYEQILPSSSVTLGWSSWAVQWLSRVPALIPDQVQVAYSQDAGVRSAFYQQAADDWRCFLLHRAAELRPGGRLVVLSMALDDHGDFGYKPCVVAIYGAVLDLVHEGFITKEEARRMVIPTVGRSRRDFTAPFAESNSFADLRLEEIDVFYGEDRIWTEFQSHGDARMYAARWAAFSRASVCPTLAASLDNKEVRAAEFIDRMEARMIARLQVAPEPMLIPLAKMVLGKGPRE
jgi:SAM dependent carboxyl methyltransferase